MEKVEYILLLKEVLVEKIQRFLGHKLKQVQPLLGNTKLYSSGDNSVKFYSIITNNHQKADTGIQE